MNSILEKFKLFFSCKDYSENCSKSRDQALSLQENIRFTFHHFLCFTCRRFSKQLDIIDSACRSFCSTENEIEMKDDKQLSDSAKLKISNALKEEKNR